MNPADQRFGFLFPADTGRWLFILRVGLGLEILFYTLSLRSDWNLIFGGSGHGLLGRDVADAMTVVQSPLIPRLGWFIFLFQQIGLDESLALSAIWWCLLTLGCFLILGLFSRPAAILTWFLQLACAKSGGLLSYGADNLITIGLFYLMIAPLPDPWSLDSLFRHRATRNQPLLGFHRRVLQVHLCLIYFFGGLTKCLGAGWWNGSNLWRSLTIPPFNILPLHWVASLGFLLPAIGIAICLLETTYPFLIWWERTRKPVLYAICALHLGVGLFMGMYLFAGIMLVLNLAAFWPREQALETEPAFPNLEAVRSST
ncbi:MAG: HTTM domain-containing protein [Candidatus Acidiferrum sp.]